MSKTKEEFNKRFEEILKTENHLVANRKLLTLLVELELKKFDIDYF